MLVQVPISVGELLDKITILEIKVGCFGNGPKLANVQAELGRLTAVCAQDGITCDGADFEALRQVNRDLWDVEDRIRAMEFAQDFGAEFVALARSVYRMNDRRFEVKRRLNERWGSALIEEKSYQQYQ